MQKPMTMRSASAWIRYCFYLLLFAIPITGFSQLTLEAVEGDPMKTELYTLENGLKVYISKNPDAPRIATRIAVRAGSKHDPADATGLAHYLEHMLFKGNSQIGSLDWAKEKVLLQQISDLYEEHRNTTDEEERKRIYQQIDSLSQEAVQYVAANEYDKMLSGLGASGTNAYTSLEQTVYVNDIPSNELAKWVKIEAARFSELALRLFHTELETVYEEFNRNQDNDYAKAYFMRNELLFPNHPYGTQTTIGKGDHLKNPSMEKIHAYFDTYYVPNNMAIILAGDVPDNAIELIDEAFGSWKSKKVPEFKSPQEKPIEGPVVGEVFGPMQEGITIAYRTAEASTDDADKLTLIDYILNNGSAGIIDLDLIQKQKVLRAGSFSSNYKDYGVFGLSGTPLKDQSLEEVEALLLAQLDKIKAGEFEDWLLDAIVNDFKKNELRSLENNGARVSILTNLYILDQSVEYFANRFERLSAITKEDIAEFAKKTFQDNYVVIYKRTGVDSTTHKVEKPEITPLTLNRDAMSAFATELKKMKEQRLDPVFVDFDKELERTDLKKGLEYFYIPNKDNDLFSLYYVVETGSEADKWLAIAVEYMEFLGTDKYTNEEFKKELFKLGLGFNVSAGSDRSYIILSGLKENFEKGVELFEHLLNNAKVDPEAYDRLVGQIEKQREDSKKSKYAIHGAAMYNFAMYGASNPFNDILPIEELKNGKPDKLISKLKELTSNEHIIFYYGPDDSERVKAVVTKYHKTPETLTMLEDKERYKEIATEENIVYYTDYDMVQTELAMLSKDMTYNQDLSDEAWVFNEYFGSGLSSIVFQEIRESKGLAYSAYAFYTTPAEPDKAHYVRGYVGTQADKLGNAVNALQELLNAMPRANDQFEDAKLSALKRIETGRITKSSIFWTYLSLRKRGIDYDQRKDQYRDIQKLTFEDLEAFFNKHIKGKTYTYYVIGKKDSLDLEALSKLGRVVELSKEELFGF